MRKRNVKEFVTFIPGINQSRAEKQFGLQAINYYDQSSFESDYNHESQPGQAISDQALHPNFSLNEGDLVINNSLYLAAIVGKENVGKVLSLNFTKVEFTNHDLNQAYFLYLLNSYRDVQRQKEREMQGTGSIQKIPLRALEQLKIPVIPLAEQEKIGALYLETLQLQSKLTTYSNLLGQFTSQLIEKNLNEESAYGKRDGQE